MTAKLEAVEVRLRGGECKRVACDAVYGDFAVHKRIIGGHELTTEWTISHRAAGIAIWHVSVFDGALKVARWLDEQRIIPSGAKEYEEWAKTIVGKERSALAFALQNICPRSILDVDRPENYKF